MLPIPSSGKIRSVYLYLDLSYWSSGPFMVGLCPQFFHIATHYLIAQTEFLQEIWTNGVVEFDTSGGGER